MIIDKIRSHPNNNPVEIIEIILNNGFDVSKGLVYSIDDTTVLKRIPLCDIDPIEAVTRVNNVVPGFIKYYEVKSDTQIDLYLTKYKGIHPRPNTGLYSYSITDKQHALTILDACIDFVKKAKPNTYNDFSEGNILLDGEHIHFIDLDQIFNDYKDTISVKEYYFSMHWLHGYMEFTEFEKIWKSHF